MFSQFKIYLAIGLLAAFSGLYWAYSLEKSENKLLTQKYNESVAQNERTVQQLNAVKEVSDNNKKLYDESQKLFLSKLDETEVLQTNLHEHKDAYYALVKIFSDHDFEKLIKAKPGLIPRRMRTGTARLFKQLEEASTGTDDSVQGPEG